MKVKDIQEQLRKFDPEWEVICYSEDEELHAKGSDAVMLDILGIETMQAEQIRKGNRPLLRFGKTPVSKTMVFLRVTADF